MFELENGMQYSVGSVPCFNIINDPLVEPSHCLVINTDKHIRVQNKSKFGTYSRVCYNCPYHKPFESPFYMICGMTRFELKVDKGSVIANVQRIDTGEEFSSFIMEMDKDYTIGRSDTMEKIYKADEKMSNIHAVMKISQNKIYIQDGIMKHSLNGTWVYESKIDMNEDHLQLRLGSTTFVTLKVREASKAELDYKKHLLNFFQPPIASIKAGMVTMYPAEK